MTVQIYFQNICNLFKETFVKVGPFFDLVDGCCYSIALQPAENLTGQLSQPDG